MEEFRFKAFTIQQDRCAMKVGTDGVLLGAWASLDHNPKSILDIGSGTGLIALQMAQRSTAELIDAIELDENAFEQCVENFEASPWSDRLFCYHASFQEFIAEMDEPYDLIISNPPFYKEDVPSRNFERDKARQSQSLPFDVLLEGVSKLLSVSGQFAVVVPFAIQDDFCSIASSYDLFPLKITHVKGNYNSPFKRSLLQFSKNKIEVKVEELVIEKERHLYTDSYINLTKDFYLKM
ncbi:tRNA1(Val) (adenine(37)-N6)-methyltransferase [Croceivirga thetidis]|uniref:tRNA1(Val) (adenine(37)-N6)-methyltransferase n=1 Tax=Croceivirga thetidis TaxID=2721623 RepID=A0ABX1GP30_9FLAO|nr:methyltransferase [Croceivirga thetidis]NKI30801.1 methyltransferase [Croceivirga thetidis]